MATKRQIKQIAKVYAASLVYFSFESGAYSKGLTTDENDELMQQVKLIAAKIYSGEYMGGLDDIVKSIIKTKE